MYVEFIVAKVNRKNVEQEIIQSNTEKFIKTADSGSDESLDLEEYSIVEAYGRRKETQTGYEGIT